MRSGETTAPFVIGSAWVAVLGCALGLVAEAYAQPAAADPVEPLRQVLKGMDDDPRERDRHAKKQIEALHDLNDLGRALQLVEWHADDWDRERAAIDRTNQLAVARRLEAAVREALRSGDAHRRLGALRLLLDMSAARPPVLWACGIGPNLSPDLADLVRHDQAPICEAAADLLGRIDADPAVAVPALGGALAAPEAARRRAAAGGLANLVWTALQSATANRAARVGGVSRKDLVAVAKTVVPVAGRGLGDPDPEVRRLSLEAVAQAAAAFDRLVLDPRFRGLVEESADPRAQLQEEVADLLPLIRVLADQGPGLLRALEDPDGRLRQIAGRALEDLAAGRQRLNRRANGLGVVPSPDGSLTGEKPRPNPLLEKLQTTLPALIAQVNGPDVRARRRAIDVLETLGPAAAPAAPALVGALADSDRFVRWAAARTLGKLGPVEPATAVPALERLLADADLDLCRAAAGTLERYGPAARPALAGLLRALQAPDAELRVAVIRTLRSIHSDGADVVAALRAAAADRDGRVRQIAGDVLAKLEAAQRPEPRKEPALDPSEFQRKGF
jgi:HEAT repeat protein